MYLRTKEVEGLRRLAGLLREAVTAATGPAPSTEKQAPRIKKFRPSGTSIVSGRESAESYSDAPKPR